MHRRSTLVLSLLVILGVCFPMRTARAQDIRRVEIVVVDSAAFPELSLQFEAFDEQNRFFQDLQADQVRVLEDGQPRPLRALELLQPGVQLTVAYNLGPELSNHFAGVSRFEAFQAALTDWALSQPRDSSDQFSLAANTGMQLIRNSNPAEWVSTLTLYKPDVLAETPNLNSLTRAVDLATDPNPESQRKQAILFITPLIFSVNMDAISNLAERAASQGVVIHVWLAGSESSPTSSPEIVQALEALASQTGGQFFLFSGEQQLPDIDAYLDPLRYAYRAVIDSQANTTASHLYQVQVERGGVQFASETQGIFIKVEPPNPIFLSPPTAIERVWSKAEGQKEETLLPQTTSLRILVEFPDGHIRQLKTSRLYVNDELAAENTSPPFDEFSWDLSNISSDKRVLLKVEVEDVLGLSKASIETPVDITVEPQKAQPLKAALTGKRLLTFFAILTAGVVLALALILTGRQASRRWRFKRSKEDKDPLTQPVPAKIEPPSQPRRSKISPAVEKPSWPRPSAAEIATAPAWLVRVAEDDAIQPEKRSSKSPTLNLANAIPLARREITVGSDHRRAQFPIEAASVSGLHARIQQTTEGEYRILDTGSTAGTWVNYAPVPAQGLLLKHGDLVQIGRVAFRFQLANPPLPDQPCVDTFKDLA